ncbi:MAG: hypothetical protein VX644_00180 [Planctomycetota bacterium]|nr:hypothetical protein [Planctomycetota bacterium]
MTANVERSKKAKRPAARDSQQQSPNVYIPAQARPLNRRLITCAAILFAGWLVFLVYAAIQATR